MKIVEVLYPFYCFNCGNLAFVHRQLGDEQLRIADFISLKWQVHSCFKIDRDRFGNNPHIQKLHTLDWKSDRLPFVHRILPSVPKQRHYSAGIVISLPTDGKEGNPFMVLTPENSVIEIKSVQKTIPEICGVLIDISDHVRIGKGKFRINTITRYVVPDYLQLIGQSAKDVYQVNVSSTDAEKLETFVDRLLKVFVEQRIAPLSILPLKMTRSNRISKHHRQMTIPSNFDFNAIIEKLSVPDFIELSARQVKTPEVETETMIDVKQE